MPVSVKHTFPRASLAPALLAVLGAALAAPAHAQDVITFDDLPAPPAVDQGYELQFANNNNYTFDAVTFTGGWGVTGKEAGDRGDHIPVLETHSGNYAVVFDYGNPQAITTRKTLYGFWAGTLQYRDPYQPVTSVTVDAVDAQGNVLGSVDGSFYTKKPTFVDTSAFAKLNGIAGYTFTPDQTATQAFNGDSFSLDDLTFSPASSPVPEASTTVSFGLLLALGLGGLVVARRKTAIKKATSR